MKAQTKITHAVKLYRVAASEYARVVLNTPVIPKNPRVTWYSGIGWSIDGKHEPGNAPAIVEKYDLLARQCWEAIKTYRIDERKPSRKPKRGSEVKPGERSGASQERLDEAERQP